MVTNSRRSSNKSNCLIINSAFLAGENPKTQALHKFIPVGMTASVPYVRENGVSLVDFLGVVRYAHITLGNSLAYLPLAHQSFLQPVHDGFISGLSLSITLRICRGRVPIPDAEAATKLVESFAIKLQPII